MYTFFLVATVLVAVALYLNNRRQANALRTKAYEYAGYDALSVYVSGTEPSATQLINALRSQKKLLARRAERLAQEAQSVATEDTSFLLESIDAFDWLLATHADGTPTFAGRKRAVKLARAGYNFGFWSIDCPAKLSNDIREWSKDSAQWCWVVIVFAEQFSSGAQSEATSNVTTI